MGQSTGYHNQALLLKLRTRDHVTAKCIANRTIKTAKTIHLWTVWDKGTHRFIGLDIIQRAEDGTWGYKDLCEGDGLHAIDCPAEFLTLAPITPAHAKSYNPAWRAKVLKRNQATEGK